MFWGVMEVWRRFVYYVSSPFFFLSFFPFGRVEKYLLRRVSTQVSRIAVELDMGLIVRASYIISPPSLHRSLFDDFALFFNYSSQFMAVIISKSQELAATNSS